MPRKKKEPKKELTEEEKQAREKELDEIMGKLAFGASFIPNPVKEESPNFISINIDFLGPDERPILGPPDSIYLSQRGLHRIWGVPRERTVSDPMTNVGITLGDLDRAILLPDFIPLTMLDDAVVKCSRLGLSGINNLGFRDKFKIHRWIDGTGPAWNDLDLDLAKEMIKRGRITFRRLDNGQKVHINSAIAETFIINKIKILISNSKFKQYITKADYDNLLSQYPHDDYIGTDEEVRNLAKAVGMIIPPYATNAYKYYKKNLRFYDSVAQGSPVIENAPDLEIFTKLGVYFHYSSREDLLAKALAFVNQTEFIIFRPFSMYYAKNNQIKGDMPTTLEESKDIIEGGNGIAWGHINYFHMISYEELYYGVSRNQSFKVWNISTFDPPIEMTEIEIYRLLATVWQYITEDIRADFIKMIRGRREDLEDTNKVNIQLRNDYMELSPQDQALIIEWFDNIFLAGMFFRQWSGNGEYPMSSDRTNAYGDEYAQSKGSIKLAEADKIKVKLSPAGRKYLDYFPAYHISYINRRVSPSDRINSITNYLDVISQGKQCIRVASADLVTTAYGFREFVIRNPIPNFDISRLDLIG